MPYIKSIDQYGEVRIGFNETLRQGLNLDDPAALYDDDDDNEPAKLRGRRLSDFGDHLQEGELIGSHS